MANWQSSKKYYLFIPFVLVLLAPLACKKQEGTIKNDAPKDLGSWQPQLNNSFQTESDAQQIINFLTGDSLLREGTQSFQTDKGKTPLSFASTNIDYWGGYVCSSADCKVKDIVRENPFSVIGEDEKAESTKLQVERTLATQGASIYDSAMWQIALAIGSRAGLIEADQTRLLIDNQTRRLRKTVSKAIPPNSKDGSGGFTYGEKEESITNQQYAYGLRFLAPSFFIQDPFKGNKYSELVSSPELMIKEGKNKHITVTDWKPITGENAWGFLLGPLQATYLLHGSNAGNVPFDDLAVQNALDFLRPLQHMQSSLGAFFYATNSAVGNNGGEIMKGTISIENNVSALAGIQVLKEILVGIQTANKGLSNIDKAKLKTAANAINIMLYGGKTPQGKTEGLIPFFKKYAYNGKMKAFYQGGTVNKGVYKSNEEFVNEDHYAADVNTWGVVAVGPETLDGWFGKGTAYKMWLTVKEKSGFSGTDGELWGIGYSDNRTEQVVSGEWTFGALTMVRVLSNYYTSNTSSEVDVEELKKSEAEMTKHMLDLRTDNYKVSWSKFKDGVEPKYQSSLAKEEKAFLYSSKRTYIPFGWYGNPVPSSASTTWALTWTYGFNPFYLGGSMTSVSFGKDNTAYDAEDYQIAYDTEATTIINTLEDAVIAVSYKASGSNYMPLISADKPIGNAGYERIQIPEDATELGIAFNKPAENSNQWYGACKLKLTAEVKEQLKRRPTQTAIKAIGSKEGRDSCLVIFAEDTYQYTLPKNLDY